jgi:hypothetical protein
VKLSGWEVRQQGTPALLSHHGMVVLLRYGSTRLWTCCFNELLSLCSSTCV